MDDTAEAVEEAAATAISFLTVLGYAALGLVVGLLVSILISVVVRILRRRHAGRLAAANRCGMHCGELDAAAPGRLDGFDGERPFQALARPDRGRFQSLCPVVFSCELGPGDPGLFVLFTVS